MPKKVPQKEIDLILQAVSRFPEGGSVEDISGALDIRLPHRTLQRRLALLVEQKRLIAEGRARGSRYRLPVIMADARMRRGFLYLVAIVDWASRAVLSWRLSITMEADFCVEALNEAIERFGVPEIFNTDQGAQFTSEVFLSGLEQNRIRISMDGKGRWRDNVFVERMWRSVKYEEVYLKAYETVHEARSSLAKYFDFYNHERGHQSLNRCTPWQVYTARTHLPRQPDDSSCG